jgi:hypothetical protein
MPEKMIVGHNLIDALGEAGLVAAARVARVVIDAEVGGAVRLYVTYFGDERLIDVIPSHAADAEIILA